MRVAQYCIHCGQNCTNGTPGPVKRCDMGCCTDPLGKRAPGYNPPRKYDVRFNTHTGAEIPNWQVLPRDVALQRAWDLRGLLGSAPENTPALDPLVKLAQEAHVPDHLVSRATAIYEVVRDEQDRDKAILKIAGLLKITSSPELLAKWKDLERQAFELDQRSRMLAEMAAKEQVIKAEMAAKEQVIKAEREIREALVKNKAKPGAREKSIQNAQLRTVRELVQLGVVDPNEAMKLVRGG